MVEENAERLKESRWLLLEPVSKPLLALVDGEKGKESPLGEWCNFGFESGSRTNPHTEYTMAVVVSAAHATTFEESIDAMQLRLRVQ